MKLLVIVVRGGRCILEVTKTTSILEIKQKIEVNFQIPYFAQTLVHIGKVLSNDNTVGFYAKIQDGDKVHIIINKPKTFYDVLHRFLLGRHNEEHSKLILAEYINVLENLSQDSVDRIARAYMHEGL